MSNIFFKSFNTISNHFENGFLFDELFHKPSSSDKKKRESGVTIDYIMDDQFDIININYENVFLL